MQVSLNLIKSDSMTVCSPVGRHYSRFRQKIFQTIVN
jgi:hypothetical protein